MGTAVSAKIVGSALFAVVLPLAVSVANSACSSSTTEGVSAEIVLESPREPKASIANDRGYTFVLTQAYLSVGSVEIRACAGARRPSLDPLFEPFGVATAHAHTVGSATKLGVSAVESMLAPSATRRALGVLVPPATNYCTVIVGLRAADADALGATTATIGKTLHVEGTFVGSGVVAGAPPETFVAETTASDDIDVSTRIDLTRTGRRTVVVAKDTDHWFDGIEPKGMTSEALARAILANIHRAIRIVVE